MKTRCIFGNCFTFIYHDYFFILKFVVLIQNYYSHSLKRHDF